MADARTTALRNLVDAFGGNPPDWIRAEYDAACAALNTRDPMRDAAPDMLDMLADLLKPGSVNASVIEDARDLIARLGRDVRPKAGVG